MRTIPLGGKKAAGRVALVDDGDYDLVMAYRWHILQRDLAGDRDAGPYAIADVRRPDGRRTSILMHILITGSKQVDHKNHDGLDNQRANLRLATNSQNAANARARQGGSSRFRGVSWRRRSQKWRASICVGGSSRYLGLFASEGDAARAYDAAALAAWGEYAWLNFDQDHL